MIARDFDRGPEDLRPITIQKDYTPADGSVLYDCGRTRVLCTASVLDQVPDFLKDEERGWLTATYEMLPASTPVRQHSRGGHDGRSQEIKRLIGRSLRGALDFQVLGPRTIYVDCHVIYADAGTRTAAINGGYIAVAEALSKLLERGEIESNPLSRSIQAVSVGIVDGEARLDLYYPEDASAEVDLNVVAADAWELVEIQGTAEGQPFSRKQLDALLDTAFTGLEEIRRHQQEALE